MADDGGWDRRSLLRGAAVLTGAAVAAPLVGGAAAALADTTDADALFKAGKFEQAGRAYEQILRKDPTNLHAARRRGLVALLVNRFAEAERYLMMALELAPADRQTNQFLADCYTRQDKFDLSVPCWRAAGDEAYAAWFAAVQGEAYEIHGDLTRLKWLRMDPSPLVEASVNGGPTKRFTFYTGSPWLGLSSQVAKEAGLTSVYSQEIEFMNGKMWMHFGVLESFKLGGIELRNIPVEWSESDTVSLDEHDHDGMIGTWVFHHFLTTFDYAGRWLILRRKTPETAAKARADANRAGVEPLPLWLGREGASLHSRGSIDGSGPRVVGVNFGGEGEIAAGMSEETAKQLRVRIDYDRPIETFAHSHPADVYPCYPKEIRLGVAVAKDAYSYANKRGSTNPLGFDGLGHFPHSFFKPYTITLDFTDMNLYIARGAAT
ncbi:aspartyl protease family protein [Phytohabitans sp. LJ34]|uniref:aspartyl protease family protein n=1 Tax=Phytohabitans sp. LJ34 TaxID=3452217 RepID=UPI003F8ACA40